jgi:hypothetical protein
MSNFNILNDKDGNLQHDENNSQDNQIDYSNLPVAEKPYLLRQTRGYSPGQKYSIPLPPPPPPSSGSNVSKPNKE